MSVSNDPPTTVPPRPIPLWVHEVTTTPSEIALAHYELFHANIDDVFASKVEVEDAVLLLETLFSSFPKMASSSDAFHAPIAFTALRIMTRLYCCTSKYQPLCFKALKRLVDARVKKPAPVSPLVQDNFTEAHNDTTLASVSPVRPASTPAEDSSVRAPSLTSAEALLHMDALVEVDYARPSVLELWRAWDAGGIDVRCFTAHPETQHVWLPVRLSAAAKVYRDFVCCPPRPKLTKTWGSSCCCHIKTNIKAQSDVMYRILIEGYNYGVNAVVFNDVVGYTNRKWENIGEMTKYGWPEGWDSEMCNDYAPGCNVSQYYSSDRFLVIRLRAKSMFSLGFSVSAWLVFYGSGSGFPITAEIFHQDDDL